MVVGDQFDVMKFAVLILIGLTSACSMIAPRQSVRTENPSPIYSVDTYEPIGQSLLLECGVYADVFRGGELIAGAVPLVVQDNLDCRFSQTHPKATWESESVLRFINASEESEEKDKVIVANKSRHVVKLLRVDAGDIFLAMDLNPSTELSVGIKHRQGSRWISAKGVIDTGVTMNGGANLNPSPSEGQRKICVVVEDQKISVRSC